MKGNGTYRILHLPVLQAVPLAQYLQVLMQRLHVPFRYTFVLRLAERPVRGEASAGGQRNVAAER
jgi:hypothetical protein